MEIRQVKPEEMDQAISLADETFRDEDHISMGEAFPQVFSKSLQQSFAAFDGKRLVSFMGLVPSNVVIGDAKLNVFSIGAVCTHPDYRKRGLSTKILKEVYQYIDRADGSLLLISGDRGLYTRNHCYHFGKTYKYNLDRSSEITYDGLIRTGTSSDLLKINSLQKNSDVRFDSSIWEWAKLLDSGGYASIFKKKQQVFVAENNSNMDGYLVLGLPTDKSSGQGAIATDWGGDPNVVKELCLHALKLNDVSNIEIVIPWNDQLTQSLVDYTYETKANGGTIHIVNPRRLIDQLKPYLEKKDEKVAETLHFSSIKEDRLIIEWNETKLELSLEQFAQLVFGLSDRCDFRKLESVFPVPFPSTTGIFYV